MVPGYILYHYIPEHNRLSLYVFLVGDKGGPKTSNLLVDREVQEMSLKDESMKMGSVCEVYNNDNNNNHEKEALSVCFEERDTTAKEKTTNVTLDENEIQPTNTSKTGKKKQKKVSNAASSTLTTTKVVDSKSQKVDDDTSLEGTCHINVTTFFNLSAEIYLTIILRNRAEYRLILNRRGRRPSRLKSDDIPQD